MQLLLPTILAASCPSLRVIYAAPDPDLINASTQPDNLHGIEDGNVVRAHDGTFYMIGAEMYGDPKWIKMRLGVWHSSDGLRWERQRSLRNSSATFDGSDEHAASWGPFLLHDPDSDRWALSYVAYRSGGHNFSGWTTNWDGQIFFHFANVTGDAGLDSDFGDGGDWRTTDQPLLRPDPLGAPWPRCQGLQGTDSFYPYKLPNGTWAALVGTAHQEGSWHPATPTEGRWSVSLALAPALAGPWTRYNPHGAPRDAPCANITEGRTENPIVKPLPAGGFMAVYDDLGHEGSGFGYVCSQDGVRWCRGAVVAVPGGCRTPFGLIDLSTDELERFKTAIDGYGVTTTAAIAAANSSVHWLFYTRTAGGWERFRYALVERQHRAEEPVGCGAGASE
eukprot:3978399-Prymnesium_polylepis.1